MQKAFLWLLALLLCCTFAIAETDEDWSWADALSGPEGPGLADTFIFPSEENEDEVLMLDEPKNIYEADGSILITLTATGDFTVGDDSRKSTSIWKNELKKHENKPEFCLENIKDILLADDLTLVNFEGTLTDSKYVPASKRENEFLFSAPPSYAQMLLPNGIEAVSLENNHVMDHGEDVYLETQAHLDEAGVVWSNSTHLGVIEVKGVQIAMLSYLCIDRYNSLWDKVPADIQEAKEQYPIVIVSFHWGNEKDYSPTNNQVKMGHLAVDAGADLVIGHHSHRLNPIEYYNGVYICYSLGNFCFAGNSKPSDMTSYMFQTRFRLRDGEVSNEGFRIIPIRISSRTERNDFIPTADIGAATVDSILTTLQQNGKKLEYAVQEYPLEWK